MDFSILSSYTFQVVALGTIFLGFAAGVIGCLGVLKKQSLVGDALGHSSFAGIVVSFMLFQSREPFILAMGAFAAGLIAFYFIQKIVLYSHLDIENVLAFVLSTFFGLGLVLKSYIQGNPSYQNAAQSGLQNYIFGQAAFIMKSDVIMIMVVSGFVLATVFVFYRKLKISIFDEQFAISVGINQHTINRVILITMAAIISIGLKAVGAVLISSMLIAPAVSALQWSHRFSTVLILSGLFGAVGALIGSFLSSTIKNMPTGPAIIVTMSFLIMFSIIFGRYGSLKSLFKKKVVE